MRNTQEQSEKNARTTGIVMTAAVHLVMLAVLYFSGLTYIFPPPPESTFLLDFEEEIETPRVVQERNGRAPQAEEIDRSNPVNLVQKSQSETVAKRENLTPATKPDDFGDVPVKEPERKEEPKLDPRATFPGMAKKDTSLTAEHAASEASNTYKAGQAAGNSNNAKTEGKPNAHLKGRNVVGQIARPSYGVQESGTVVVSIWVDRQGNVVKAMPGADGTTVTSSALWNAARKAAMETHFNVSDNAPDIQEGKITYIFTLK